jgi:hypothetical protein
MTEETRRDRSTAARRRQQPMLTRHRAFGIRLRFSDRAVLFIL